MQGGWFLNMENELVDDYIINLNRDLVAIEACMSSVLPRAKMSYILDSLPKRLAAAFMRGVANIKGCTVSSSGIRRLKSNTFAVQQVSFIPFMLLSTALSHANVFPSESCQHGSVTGLAAQL